MRAAAKVFCLCLSVAAHGAALWAMTSGEAPRGAGAGEASGAPSVLTFVSPAAAQVLVQAWETPPDVAPAPAAIQAPPSPAAALPRLPPPAPALSAPPPSAPMPTSRATPTPLGAPPSPDAELPAIAPSPAPPPSPAEAAPRRSLRPAARDPRAAESAEAAEAASAPPRDTAGPARAPRQPPPQGTSAAAGAAPAAPAGGGGPSAAAAAGLRDSWAGAIRNAIARVHQVPQAAIRQGLSGRVVLRVEVAPDGRVAGVGYVERSGSAVLDDAAMATLRRARLPPAPGGVSGAVTVDVPLRFTVR